MIYRLILMLILPAILLAGCFETIEEVTLRKDGSGLTTSTTDMSAIIGIVKQMGKDLAGNAGDKVTDTTISLARLVDSIPALTGEEKALLEKGNLGLIVNMKDEKLLTKLEIPFSKLDQVDKIKVLSARMTQYFIGKNLGNELPPGMDDQMPEPDPMQDYFTTTYTSVSIEKKLNKEKYSRVNESQSMMGLKEISEKGMPSKNTIIFNLPKPARKVTGKNLKLSEDKKKVTITTTSEDFFSDGSLLEFKIEY